MTREEIHAAVAEAMADEHERMRADLEAHIDRTVAGRALPPFVPPPIWTEGRHGAGVSVRHRNGIFMARRDTEGEPGRDDAWLPLIVGLAGVDVRWSSERTMTFRAMLSDGTLVETTHEVAVPIVRGYWEAARDYDPGDRVFHHGEWHALKPSRGIEPGGVGCEDDWLKVIGKHARAPLALSLNDEGEMRESGRLIGTLKPLITSVLNDLAQRHRR